MDFLRTHPYLIANIPTLFIILVLARFIRPRAFGRLAVLAGLACLPCSLIAFTYEGEYWNPVRLGGIAIGVEDVIYCFAGGALAWMAAAWPFRTRFASTIAWPAAAKRYVALGLGGGTFFALAYFSGAHAVVGFTIGSLLILITLLVIRRDLWLLVPTGAVGYTLLHVLSVRVQFWVWPDYVQYWNPAGQLGTRVMGVPVNEFAWAVVFGSVWPVIIGYLFDVRLGESPARRQTDQSVRSR